ncbi:MAG: hypothetical protein ACFFD4_27630 [Candidatus Odinarchaeota archaeon]
MSGKELRKLLKIPEENLKAVNDYLLSPDNTLINSFIKVIEKYGGVEEIKKKYEESSKLENLMARVKEKNPDYYRDLEWLREQRDKGAFITIEDYRKKVLGDKHSSVIFKDDFAVTLELSALQYFPQLIKEAKKAIQNGELMPGRFIRVRKMKEQENDGDLLAVAAAMRIVGASYVETLDTKGTDGSNIHLGGPETITGYFGGVGQPNTHALKWLDEYLYYHTNYGLKSVLNVNPGTIILGYFLYKIGVTNEFKISVFVGNDNPYSVFWTFMTAKLFSRPDGTSPLIGFNYSNSVNNETIELSAEVRKAFDFEDVVRFEHHIVETYKSIVIQPYNRLDELIEIADGKVKNISAKHEGAYPDVEETEMKEHPSDILDYFLDRPPADSDLWEYMMKNHIGRHDAVNRTAWALTEKGIPVVAAWNLHK